MSRRLYMDITLIGFSQKTSYPAVELASQSTACSASFIQLFQSSLPVDSLLGYNIGSEEDGISETWGIPDRLGGMALVNAGAGIPPVDLYPEEDAVLPEQNAASSLVFGQNLDLADNIFAMAPPYVDGSSSLAHPLSADDGWLPTDGSTNHPADDRVANRVDDPGDDVVDELLDPENDYGDDGLLIS